LFNDAVGMVGRFVIATRETGYEARNTEVIVGAYIAVYPYLEVDVS
jgi:hypothetical protein